MEASFTQMCLHFQQPLTTGNAVCLESSTGVGTGSKFSSKVLINYEGECGFACVFSFFLSFFLSPLSLSLSVSGSGPSVLIISSSACLALILCIAAQVSDGKVLESSPEGLVTSGVDRTLHFDRLYASTLPRSFEGTWSGTSMQRSKYTSTCPANCHNSATQVRSAAA